MSESLGGYIEKLLNEVSEVKELQQAVRELHTEVRELKDMITNHTISGGGTVCWMTLTKR